MSSVRRKPQIECSTQACRPLVSKARGALLIYDVKPSDGRQQMPRSGRCILHNGPMTLIGFTCVSWLVRRMEGLLAAADCMSAIGAFELQEILS